MVNFLSFVLLLHWVSNPARGQEYLLSFTISEVVQCSPFAIGFSSNATAMDSPLTLTVLPFSDEPLTFPIPDTALNTSGVSVSFIPIRANKEFIASVDDSAGQNIALVSGVTTVLPSLAGNDSCLSSSGNSVHSNGYKVLTTPGQCQDISITYDTTYVMTAPTVRAFTPNGNSVVLPQTSDDPVNGTATYTIILPRGTQMLLMFDDGMQYQGTSDLMTVAGDSNSPKDCLNDDKETMMNVTQNSTATAAVNVTGNPQDNTQGNAAISHEVIIGCSAGGAVILIIAISMIVFVIRDRKLRRRKPVSTFFDSPPYIPPMPSEPPPKPPKDVKIPFSAQPTQEETSSQDPFEESSAVERAEVGDTDGKVGGYVTNPPYVMGQLKGADDGKSPLARRSFSSWTTDDQLSTRDASMHRRPSVDPVQVLGMDIEEMLNRATALSGTQTMKQATESEDDDPRFLRSARESQSTVKSLSFPYPKLIIPATRMGSRHWRAPSDVPADLTGSGTLSGFSMIMPNPLNDDTDVELPSPFNRTDEPARPASETVRPISFKQEEEEEGKSTNREEEPEQEKSGEGRREMVIKRREET